MMEYLWVTVTVMVLPGVVPVLEIATVVMDGSLILITGEKDELCTHEVRVVLQLELG